MTIKRIEHLEAYRVRRPNGQTDIVDVYQKVICAASMDNPNAEIAGQKSAKLRGKHSVNFNGDDGFRDIFPEEDLKIIDRL